MSGREGKLEEKKPRNQHELWIPFVSDKRVFGFEYTIIASLCFIIPVVAAGIYWTQLKYTWSQTQMVPSNTGLWSEIK